MLYFFEGDFFRKLWGPYAGWAQSVSVIDEYLSACFCHVRSVCDNHRVFSSVVGFVLCGPQEVPKAERDVAFEAAAERGRC